MIDANFFGGATKQKGRTLAQQIEYLQRQITAMRHRLPDLSPMQVQREFLKLEEVHEALHGRAKRQEELLLRTYIKPRLPKWMRWGRP